MNSVKIAVFAIVLILFQILLNGILALVPYINIIILPIILIIIPSNVKSVMCMLYAFAAGICVDYLSDGVIGLNAAAMVAVAFAREFIFKLVLGRGQFNEHMTYNMRIKTGQYLIINLFVYSLWFAIYQYLDDVMSYRISVQLIRFLINVVVNSALAVALEIIIDKEMK